MKSFVIIIAIICCMAGCKTIEDHTPDTSPITSTWLIKIGEPCDYGRWANIADITDIGAVVDSIFRAQLECYKTYSPVDERYKIKDYIFDEKTNEYAIQIDNIAISNRAAGDGRLSWDRIIGKHLMFTQLHQSGDVILMTRGTGP